MSYDFTLFQRRDGEDPNVTARQVGEELGSTPLDATKEARKRRIADALIAHNPKLTVFEFGYEEIAKQEKISVEEARLRYRHLELNGPEEDRRGIQITLFDDGASVTVAYWHGGEAASDAFREIWGYLEIVSRESGYLIYDPQTDRVVDLASGFEDALARYSQVARAFHKELGIRGPERRPWWKFW